MIDRRGILAYLGITFVVTYAVEGLLVARGVRFEGIPHVAAQYVVAAVMWVPAVAALLTVRLVTREGARSLMLRIGPRRPYVVSALLVPLVFAVVYGITWALGLAHPDWQLQSLRDMMAAAGADATLPVPAPVLLAAIFLLSIVIGPTVNGIAAFGEELGWRGYLLPRLMPLGRWPAFILVGVIWGLWHAPIVAVGFNYPGYPALGVIWMCLLTTAIGVFINVMALRHRSSVLAGWIHGAFNGQAYGIWRILFPDANPLIGGITGLVGIVVWLLVGLWAMRRDDAAAAATADGAATTASTGSAPTVGGDGGFRAAAHESGAPPRTRGALTAA